MRSNVDYWLLLQLTWHLVGALTIPTSTATGSAQTLLGARVASGPEDIAALVQEPYHVDAHTVQTTDGYLLSVYRLSKADQGPGSGRQAVLLQHGLLDSCAGFLLQGPGSALAFLLADAGLDVWLSNSRGSTQARRHAWLSVTSAEFWAFSFDEMAQYDLPETVAYVRAVTGQDKLHFVAHSQGGTILLAALAGHTLSSDHLGMIALMAPVTMATHISSVPFLTMSALGTDKLFLLLGVREFMPSIRVISWLEGELCTIQPDLCISILVAFCGYNRGALNSTRLPLYLKYTPAGSSVQNMAHWAQVVRGGGSPGHPSLEHFDWGTYCGFGKRCNQYEYGSDKPPVYQLSAIDPQARIYLFSGDADRLADPVDIELLLEALPPGVLVGHQIDHDFEHLDYIWGTDAAKRVYSNIISLFTRMPTY